jgi:hypothetical protein
MGQSQAVMLFAVKWVELKDKILNKMIQTHKAKYCMFFCPM